MLPPAFAGWEKAKLKHGRDINRQMTYETLTEIFASIEETRARLFERIATLSEEQENARADADGWSVREIVEHLSLVEKQIVKLATLMLMKAETAGEKASPDGRIGPVSLDRIAERASREKYQAPDTARPSGAQVTDSLAVMRASREALHGLRPRLEATNLSSVSYPHPAFGPLNLYEWFVMIGVHEERHIQQIDAILKS
jgi:hypothetical protein